MGLLVAFAVSTGVTPQAAAKAGDGITIGKLTVHPHADGSGTWDANVGMTPANEEDDVFLEGKLGLNLLLPTKLFDLSGNVSVLRREYLQSHDNVSSHTDFMEKLGLTIGGRETLLVRLSQSYQQLGDESRLPVANPLLDDYGQPVDPVDEAGTRVGRDRINASVAVGKDLTDKIDADLMWKFDTVLYDSGALLDRSGHKFRGDLGYGITDKSDVFVSGTYGIHVSDAFPDNPISLVARGGWKTALTAKTGFKASAGVHWFDYQSEPVSYNPLVTPSDPASRSTTDEFVSFELAWFWHPTKDWSFNVSGGNSAETSPYEIGNWKKVAAVSAGAVHHLTSSLTCHLTATYRNDEYQYAYANSFINGDGEIETDPAHFSRPPRERDAIAAVAGLTLSPRGKPYSLYLNARHEVSDSNYPDEDFDRTRVQLGGRVIY